MHLRTAYCLSQKIRSRSYVIGTPQFAEADKIVGKDRAAKGWNNFYSHEIIEVTVARVRTATTIALTGNIVNRVFDSSGPEGKVRGTPQQIIDKYLGAAPRCAVVQ